MVLSFARKLLLFIMWCLFSLLQLAKDIKQELQTDIIDNRPAANLKVE
jgi:hypothetical protein